ncbi:M15 family metallopeptidase [Cnuibacter sp. UC19_7]|uniref:M15 family metallopeptidase n=1 Tax=Cnuibacter sp. UC19_7 TaxID=3350166 RepID=UPI00366A6DC4
MTTSAPRRTGTRTLALVAIAVGALAVLFALSLPLLLSSSALSLGGRPIHDAPLLGPATASEGSGAAAGTGSADGALPDGATIDDDRYPGITRLDPTLRSALSAAAEAMAGDGIRMTVTSGWRSAALQEQLLQEAVGEYGSREQAERWVATPETSLHVAGQAVDVGPWDAAIWLDDHGAEYGLCRIYVNEPWHFELRLEAMGGGCPPTYLDPTEDPRLQS